MSNRVFFIQVCELGERLTDKFSLFGITIYQWNWNYFPVEVQKMLIIVLADLHEPVIVRGFANTLCARESFKKVIQTQLNTISIIQNGFSFLAIICFFRLCGPAFAIF